MSEYKMHMMVCGGTGCRASQSDTIVEKMKKELEYRNLDQEVQVVITGCFGFCEKGPIVKMLPDNTFYTQVKPENVTEIIDEHIIKGRKVKSLLYVDPIKGEAEPDSKHMDFYKKQNKLQLVDGVGAIDDIFSRIKVALEKI